MSKCLCITGMHRSGTSLTASWLEKCGLTLDDGLRYGAGVGNSQGHFEDVEFVKLHSAVIAAAHPRSHGWIVTDSRRIPVSKEHRQQMQHLAESREIRFNLWGWKDPRSTLLLPTWKKLLPELKVLLLWRPCAEVVGSLVHRSRRATQRHYHVSGRQAVRAWIAYNRAAIEFKRMYPEETLLLPLSTVIESERMVHASLCERFAMPLEYVPLSDLFEREQLRSRRFSPWQRLYAWMGRIQDVEAELFHRSDSLSTISVPA